MAEPTAEPGTWLTVSEATSRLAWHPDRMKSAIRRGRIQARKNNAGKWLVLVTPDLVGTVPDTPPDPVYDTDIADLRDALTRAVERAARAEGRAEAMLAAVSDLRQTLEHERQEKAELRRELAEARRPWLAKVLGGLRRR